jgi:hypothetical protein
MAARQWLSMDRVRVQWSSRTRPSALLQWARAHGCLWNAATTKEATDHGRLTTLRWARENGCDVGYRVWTPAARGGHLGVLEYLCRTYGLRCADECKKVAEKNGHRALVRWFDEQTQNK